MARDLRRKIYLAGPMDGCSYEEVHGWRDSLKKNYDDIQWLDPSDRFYQNPFEDWKVLVEEDLGDIQKAHALLAYIWRPSAGTSMELVVAHSIMRIPVVVMVDDLTTVGPWVKYHADYVVDDFEEAHILLNLMTW